VIEAMFEVLYQRGGLSAGFGEFVRSMHQQFHALGYLSARQFTVLRTAAERHGFEAA
jgi:hypothetical protein